MGARLFLIDNERVEVNESPDSIMSLIDKTSDRDRKFIQLTRENTKESFFININHIIKFIKNE